MKPRPIRMPDSLWDELQAEAEDNGMTAAEYVRKLLRNRQSNTQPNTQADTATVDEKLAALESRIDALEPANNEEPDTLQNTQADTQPNTEFHLRFDWDKIGYAETEDRHDVLVAVYEYLREHEVARTPELVQVAEEHGVTVGTPQRLISDALGQLEDVETPQPGSNVYRYTGD